MSIARISPDAYQRIFTSTVAQYVDLGLDLTAARSMAKNDMDRAFVSDDMQRETQRDYDDERDGDWTR